MPENVPESDAFVTSEEATNTYKRRQKESFAFVGGGPAGWRASTVRNVRTVTRRDGSEVHRAEFDQPAAYTWVTPYSDMHPEVGAGGDICQLCGYVGIVDVWYIQQDDKHLIMQVGSVCVNTFMGAEYTSRTIRIFRETKLRNAYTAWRQPALVEIDNKGTGPQRWLSYSLYQFKQKILKSEPRTTSGRIITNIFKKARAYAIPIPTNIFPDQTLQETVGQGFGIARAPLSFGQTKSTNGVKVWQGIGATASAQVSTPKPVVTQRFRLAYDAGQMFVILDTGSKVKAVKDSSGIWMPVGSA